MALEIWDQGEDLYNHLQLANNWAKVDAHDHTPGRGVRLTTESYEDESITGNKLAANSVTSAKIVDGTIKAADLEANLLIGAWQNVTYVAAVEAVTEVGVRKEIGGVVRLRGSISPKAGKTIAANKTLFTVPAACIPTVASFPVAILQETGAGGEPIEVTWLHITNTGTVLTKRIINETDQLYLDGITYAIN